MDGDAGDLGKPLFDIVFERGENIVDASDGQFALHDAVAGDKDVMIDLADANIVSIEEFVVRRSHAVQEGFDGHFQLAHFACARFRSGDMPAEWLDVDVDVDIAIAECADAIFEVGGAAMGFAEAEIFVDFEMEFDKEVAILLGSGDIVNGKTQAQSDGANGFEEVLISRSTWLGVNKDIRGDDLRDALFDTVGEFVNLLEIGGAGDADGCVDKVAVTGAPEADAVGAEHPFDPLDGRNYLILEARWSGVEKCIEGAAPELRTDPQDDASDGKARERVRINEPRQIPPIASPNQGNAENDDKGAPNVGGEMERVGFQGFTFVMAGNFVEGAGAIQIDGERHE